MDGILDGYFKNEFAAIRKKSLKEGELKRTIEFIRKQMKKGSTFDEACTYLDLTEEEIREVRPAFENES